jgi:putative ABC transport system permease protein
MLKNYIKLAIRNFYKNKAYSFINITGLAIGLAVFIMIMLYVQFQYSYDNYNKKADRIYRTVWESKGAGSWLESAEVPELLGPALVEQLPQIESFVRIDKYYPKNALVSYKDKRFYETGFLLADSTFFNIFTFRFVKGDPANSLKNPNSIVITSSIAKKYFDDKNPIGKVLTFDNENKYTVTGVIEDVPENSHLHFNFVGLKSKWSNARWYMFGSYTYILLKKGYFANDVKSLLPAFIDRNVKYNNKKMPSETTAIELQPLRSIHLHSNAAQEIEPNSDIKYVNIFIAIAFLILIIACINYTNISTSKYLRRVTEIGVRKTLGAKKRALIFQVLTESILLSFISAVLAIGLVELLSGIVSNYTGINIPALKYQNNYELFFFLSGIALITGILSGAYPAFYVSRFPAAQILRKTVSHLPLRFNMRKILIVFQFAVAVLIITATVIFFTQLHFIETKRLGFDKENVIVIKDPAQALYDNYNVFKNDLVENSQIVSVSSGDVPGQEANMIFSFGENGKALEIRIDDVDYDYLKTLGINLKEGRTFNTYADTSNLIINEKCAEIVNMKNNNIIGLKIGQTFKLPMGKVVGVVKDFNISSLREKIIPIAFRFRPEEHADVMVRIRPNSIKEAINEINTSWNKFVKDRPVQYSFLNDDLNRLYASDENIARLFGLFAFIAIFIACLGLFGVSSLVTEQRTKEIGIRKIMGASTKEIVYLLSKEFAFWVLISNVISIPVAYYFMNKWLQDFAYRITLNGWIFLIIALSSLFISLVTISFQSIRAANTNPAETLRYE